MREGLETCAVAVLAALLAWLPEWRTPGFYFHDDMQSQYVPAIIEVGRAARHGQLAILSEYSWFGGALAGEYQHGVFSLFHLLLCAGVTGLSRPSIASSVSLAYYALAAAGAYRAARVLEFRRALALAIALVAALNGFNVTWGSWLPAITGWAWLMWLWWSLERLRRSPEPRWQDVALAALTTYSVLCAGWHFADLLILPLVLAVFLRRPLPPTWRDACFRTALGPLLGACLALPALLCFVEFARAGARTDFDRISWAWTVPWRALGGFLVPLSTTGWLEFAERMPQTNVVLAGGVLPLVIVLVALAAPAGVARRRYVGLVIGAVVTLAWSMLPSLGRVRWPFRWLPVVHLLVVLAAAQVLAAERRLLQSMPEPARRRAGLRRQGVVASVGAVLVVLVLAVGKADAGAIAGGVVALLSLCVLPVAASRGLDVAGVFCGGVALNLVAVPLVLPVRAGTPTWSTDRCAERWARVDHHGRYLGVYDIWDIIDPVDQSIGRSACVLPGNASMGDRLTFVNGYSTLYTAGLHRNLGLDVHGNLNARGLIAVTGPLASAGGLLDRWGIDGLVTPVDPVWRSLESRLSRAGLTVAEDLGGARIWRRKGAPHRPLVESLATVEVQVSSQAIPTSPATEPRETWTFDTALGSSEANGGKVTLAELTSANARVEPTSVELDVRAREPSSRPGLILVRRPWLPGYRATLDERPVTLGRLDGTLLGVVIPPGKTGRLRLEYVPLGLRWPALCAVAGALLVLGAGLGRDFVRKSRRRSAAVFDATGEGGRDHGRAEPR
jgi:hypothetical protein